MNSISVRALAVVLLGFAGCGGHRNTSMPPLKYTLADTSLPMATLLANFRPSGFTEDFVSFFSAGRIIAADGSMLPVQGPFVLGLPPINNNLTGALLNTPTSIFKRPDGTYVGNCAVLPAPLDVQIAYDGFTYLWSNPLSLPTSIPVPDFRPRPAGEVPGTTPPLVEGAIPVDLSYDDYLLVRTTQGYPATFYRILIGSSNIELIDAPGARQAIIGEQGRVVTYNQTAPFTAPVTYWDEDLTPTVITSTQYYEPRVITPDGWVIGVVSNPSLRPTGVWTWRPGKNVELITPPSVENINVMGSSADGLVVGYYTDTAEDREVAFVMREIGIFEKLEDFLVAPIPLAKAGAINRQGQILGTYFDAAGDERSFIATPSP